MARTAGDLEHFMKKESVVNRKLLLAIAMAVGTASTAVAQFNTYQPNPNGYMPSMTGGVIADGYRQPVMMTNASAPNYNPAANYNPAPIMSNTAAPNYNPAAFRAPDQSTAAAEAATGGAGCGPECVGQNYFGNGCGPGCNNGCGRYLSVFAGWNSLDNFTFNDPQGVPNRADFDEGWIGGFAIGQQKTCFRRHELEFAFRDNSADALTIQNRTIPFFGDIQASSILYSVLLEPSQGICGLKPFIGAGLGAAYMDADFNDGGQGICYVQDTVFAWQLRAGIAYEINSRVSAFADYRYFAAENLDVHCTVAGGPVMTSPVDYRAESVVFGIDIKR